MAARPLFALTVALAVTACTAPGAVAPTGGDRKASMAARTRPSSAAVGREGPAAVAPPGGGLASDAGGGLISDVGGALVTLEGVVRAPAGIIANNGGAIVANNGGGLITDNGAGLITDNGAGVIGQNGAGALARLRAYGLRAAAEQQPFAGVAVVIQDAAGNPVRDDKGAVVRAVTGPDGRFRVTAPLPARNLVAVVQLVDGQGALKAIVGRGEGVRRTDVELVSTLTTGYILDQYVKGQPDPLATLERLPPAIEAVTRARAAAALAKAAAPKALTAGEVTATVDAMRKGDEAFDAQMETVKRLLIVAGQSDLGAGRPAREVPLKGLIGLLPAPDGGLYLPSDWDARIWHVATDGLLRTLAGKGGEAAKDPTGLPARDAAFGEIRAAAVDPQGRLVFADLADTGRLWRVGADGRVEKLAELGTAGIRALACAPDGKLWALVQPWSIIPASVDLDDVDDEEDTIESIAPDGTRTVVWDTVPIRLLGGVGERTRLLAGPAGELYMLGRDDDAGRATAVRLDPATKAVTALAAPAGRVALAFDRTGACYYRDEAGAMHVAAADGTQRGFLAAPPASLEERKLFVVPAPDGSAYLMDDEVVYRVAGGVATRVAGMPAEAAATGGPETAIAPDSFTILEDGRLVLAEAQRKRLVTVGADGAIAVLVPPEAGLAGPSTIAHDAAGRLYVADKLAIKVVEPDLTVRTLHTHANPAAYIHQVLAAADGTLYFAAYENPGGAGDDEDDEPAPDAVAWTAWRLRPGQAAERLATKSYEYMEETTITLALDGVGKLHGLEDDGQRLTLLAWEDAWKPVGMSWRADAADEEADTPVLDAAGRVYYTTEDHILRGDPKTGVRTVIAGPGGRIFPGAEGVDDSVGVPTGLQFDAAGDLLFVSYTYKQIKRIPKSKLD